MPGVFRLLFSTFGLFAAASAQTIVILPFTNRSDTPNVDWIGESLAENLREVLYADGFLALDRKSREEGYRRLSLRPGAELTKASILKIGEELDADRVISGGFEIEEMEDEQSSTASTLSISAQVIERTQLRQSLPFKVAGRLEDLPGLQHRLARQIEDYLGGGSQPALGRARPKAVRLDAMENYIRGLMADDPDKKHRFFTQAARLDEGYSQPRFQLGKLNWERKNYRVAAGWLERVSRGDPNFGEALFFIGLSRYHLGEYERAAAAFWEAAELVPLNEVWNNLGAAQSRLNRPEALESFRRALEGDPLDATYNFNTGCALWRKGEYEQAADRFRAVLDSRPEDSTAMTMLGRCLKRTGPARSETRVQTLERLKLNYAELAYRQLQASLAKKGAGAKEQR